MCEKNCLSIKTDVLPISATPTAKCLAHFLGGIKWRTQRKFSTSFHKKWTDQISKKKWRFAFFFPLDGCWIKNVKNLFFFLRRQEESFLQKKLFVVGPSSERCIKGALLLLLLLIWEIKLRWCQRKKKSVQQKKSKRWLDAIT